MTTLNTEEILAQEAYRTLGDERARIAEAAKLFNAGAGKRSPLDVYRLQEAFTTSDFPVTLNKAFQVEALQAQRDAVKEFEPFTHEVKVPDFRPVKLRDLFGTTDFEDVPEASEYKAASLDETEIQAQATKAGRLFGLTWELRLAGDFTNLADFPKRLGNAAVETENRKCYSVFVGDTGPRSEFFGTVGTEKLSAATLQKAIEALSLREDHRGDLVDTSGLVLVVPPTLAIEANRIVGSAELEMETTEGKTKLTNRISNPFRGMVQVQVSRRLVQLDKSANRATSWYLLPGKATATPSVIAARLQGHEQVDIRVKRDQGDRVGGGTVAFDDGSFNDDTIWFRGRHVFGASRGFTYGVYASNGSAPAV